ncbi:MAG: phosphoenolpyruvate carboxykinase (GTP) [Lentisphaerae bacterium]|jgi:phosphoenolpyruvate carboxykinase (GTP)|nr:phosphoenolpyruvate carboxykinase (GTP) [Lentisphaerota bacterium]
MAKTPKFKNAKVQAWVDQWVKVCDPDKVVVIKGTKQEHTDICEMMVKKGQFVKLNQKLRPGCYLARSHESDVARVEGRTFICSKKEIDAGPTNHWKDPDVMKKEMLKKYKGCMKGRTMYVIPFAMGPIGNPITQYGIEVTDSPYVVVNMNIMTRTGDAVMKILDKGGAFVPCIHSVGAPLKKGQKDVAWPCAKKIDDKYITQFPEDGEIWSFGSGYGGNALLGKKCFALRIASKLAKDQGWMAEHMLILTLTSPEKKKYHVTAAFPSACGKTNLAMMLPKLPGWKLETIGDDIAWLKPGEDGRLYAINPENGFFGVAPGTSNDSNPNALLSCKKNTIFTNVVLTPNGDIWWEDMGIDAPEEGIDWKGNPCYRCVDDTKRMGPKPGMTKAEVKAAGYVAAHKNSRFTAPAVNCPVLDKDGFNGKFNKKPTGVPIDAILFGGRRPSTIPLVNEAKSWTHGVFMGSAAGSEVTAAVIADNIGQVRRDPMAMLPFFGYNVADYFQHWLEMERTSANPANLPKIYFVNWFRKGEDGRFMWPGFGDNSRVLKWICQRIDGKVAANETAIGNLPKFEDIDLANNEGKFKVVEDDLKEILKVDVEGWKKEIATVGASYDEYDAKASKDSTAVNKAARRVPAALRGILAQVTEALSK